MYSIQQKHNNPLNNSPSKQLFSFPRSSRFGKQTRGQSPDAFYNHDRKAPQVAYSFGKSHRLKTQSAHKDVPSQFSYNIEGEIERALKKKSGVKILYGREDCKSKGIFQISDTPGPGNYNPNPEAFKPRITSQCSMGHDLRNKTQKDDPLPGPGAYRISSTLLNDDKVLSKYTKRSYGRMLFEDSKPTRIKTEVAPEFSNADKNAGFPEINCKGEQTFQKGRGFLIGKSQRFTKMNDNPQPGPGSYKIFTQFTETTKT